MSAAAVRRYVQVKAAWCVLLAAIFSALAPDTLIVGALLLMGALYAGAALMAGRRA